MITALRAAFRTWTPWEEKVVAAVEGGLAPKHQGVLRAQLAAVNKVQRILGWREIDFYVMREGRVDWSGVPLFLDEGEFSLATVCTRVGTERFETQVWCVGGHIFSLESARGVRPLAFRTDIAIEVLEADRRFC